MKRLTMDQIWLTAPSPAMRLGREAGASGWRVNAAAQAWAQARELSADCLWPALAAELRAVPEGTTAGELAAAPLHWQAVPIGDPHDGERLVWFTPSEAEPWRSAADKLALMQDFVAIGVCAPTRRAGTRRCSSSSASIRARARPASSAPWTSSTRTTGSDSCRSTCASCA